jgi:hypothetical protein
MSKLHIWPEARTKSGGSITLTARIEGLNAGQFKLWYRVPEEFESHLTDSCDPFVLACLFTAMSESNEMIVHGATSPSLLGNLAEFQAAWVRWKPDVYGAVEIEAETEREEDGPAAANVAMVAFTGGVDSAFTVYRHGAGHCPRAFKRKIESGLFVHGFDIPLEQTTAFERAKLKAEQTLASLNVRLMTVSTNLHAMNFQWDHCHGAGLASCMTLLRKGFAEGLIASSFSYEDLVLPYGSNPVTDPLLGSRGFRIVHEGAGFSPAEKLEEIARWPHAIENLRVCL